MKIYDESYQYHMEFNMNMIHSGTNMYNACANNIYINIIIIFIILDYNVPSIIERLLPKDLSRRRSRPTRAGLHIKPSSTTITITHTDPPLQ